MKTNFIFKYINIPVVLLQNKTNRKNHLPNYKPKNYIPTNKHENELKTPAKSIQH